MKRIFRVFSLSSALAALAFTAPPAAAQGPQVAQPPLVHGSGATNVVPLWTSSTTIGTSALSQSGSNLTTGGSITALSFAGDGSALSNVNAARLGGTLPGGFAQLGASSNTFTGNITATSFAGDGSALSNVDAAKLGGIPPGDFAKLDASSNTFTGTLSAATVNSSNPYQIGGGNVLSIAGTNNLFVGLGAGAHNTSGSFNTASGTNGLPNNTTGSANTASGYQALLSNTTGHGNTASGVGSLRSKTTGDHNTASGFEAGFFLVSGSANIMLGYQARYNFNAGESNNIDIGNLGVGAVGGAGGDSGVIRIGTAGTHTSTFIAGIRGVFTGQNDAVAVLIDSDGQLGTTSSSRRYKEDIHAMGAASDGLLRLRPVTFRYKKAYADGSKPVQYGLVAEEVAEVYPDLVVRGKDGQVETVQYYKLDAMLLNEVQKLARLHTADQAQIAKLQSQIAEQRKQAQQQDAAMKQLLAQVRVIQATLASRSGRASQRLAATSAPKATKPEAAASSRPGRSAAGR